MNLDQSTYRGPAVDDRELLDLVPTELRALLEQVNGVVLFSGGLHIRGAALAPEWHSLRRAWLSGDSINQAYPGVFASDVPFAQDCMGDQFLLRDRQVIRLLAEDGSFEPLGVDLSAFLDAARSDPLEYLGLHPLVRFMEDGGRIRPGQLLVAYPPFMFAESGEGVALEAVAADEAIRFHSDLARQMRGVPDGTKVEVRVRPPNTA